jgi:hypothetical protein
MQNIIDHEDRNDVKERMKNDLESRGMTVEEKEKSELDGLEAALKEYGALTPKENKRLDALRKKYKK